jgi:ribonuclease BN (tRNA processing enzyme)
MAVKLTVVGCSPAWPNPGGAQSGYLVEANGYRLLLDCGAGVLARLREQEPWPRVDAVAITHFHLDHWGDLVPWVWGGRFGPGRDVPKPELWLPPGGRAQLAHLGMHLGTEDMFERAFAVRDYADREPFSAGPSKVVPFRLVHYELLTFGFRVECDSRVLAYSGDSAPCAELVDLARAADLFLCEATLDDASSEADLRGHLTEDEAEAAYRASGAARLLLTHRPHERPLDDRFEAAYDGMELEL